MFYRVIRALFFLPTILLYPTKVIGKENLINGKSILICNHQSNLDGIIIGVKLKQKINFLGKAELFKNKLFSWFFKHIKVIKVNRGEADLKAIKDVLTCLKNEGTVCVFPEGTRNIEEESTYKNGVAMFSVKANAPIVPMRFLSRPKIFHKNTLVIGQPFYLKLEQNEKLTKEVLERLTQKIKNVEDNLKQN